MQNPTITFWKSKKSKTKVEESINKILEKKISNEQKAKELFEVFSQVLEESKNSLHLYDNYKKGCGVN